MYCYICIIYVYYCNYICLCNYICNYICKYIYGYVCVCVCLYIYIYIYTHTHIYIYITMIGCRFFQSYNCQSIKVTQPILVNILYFAFFYIRPSYEKKPIQEATLIKNNWFPSIASFSKFEELVTGLIIEKRACKWC